MITPETSTAIRNLEREIRLVAHRLMNALNNDGDMAAGLLEASGELERLSEAAVTLSEEVLLGEQGR